MIVMSTAARALLNKMKFYCPNVCYEATDIEWYAHTYLLSALENWWKSRIAADEAIHNSHEWFLPKPGSKGWKDFCTYSKNVSRKAIFELVWDDNLKHVYHYLCGSVLLSDFGVDEFRRITLLAIHPLRKVQKTVEKAKSSCRGPITTPYILSILERGEQAEQTKSDRIQKMIEDSQKVVVQHSFKRATSLEATLMKAQFMEIRVIRDLDRKLNEVSERILKERFKHAIT